MTAPAQTPQTSDVMAAFAAPDPVGGDRPAVRDLVGRVVVIRPTKYEERVPGVEAGTVQDRVTADVMVVDGGTLEFGGNPDPRKFRANSHAVTTPYLIKDMFISNTNLVKAVKDHVNRAVVLGEVTMGIARNPAHNNPYNLLELDGSDPRRKMAGAAWTQFLNRTFVNPEPQKIGGAPAQPAAVQAVAQPAAAAAAAAADPAAAFAAWQAQQQAAKSAPPAAASIPPAPEGWDADVWAGLTDAQRAQVLGDVPPFA